MFRFASPEWLLSLLLIPLLAGGFWLAARRRTALLKRFGETELVRKLTASVSQRARLVKAGLILAAVAFLALALARPQFGTRVETVRRRGQDVMVAVDLSRSMLAEDVTPNRLDRARLAILRLIRNLDGDRIGLVAFAGDAFIQSPLTVDYTAAAMFLDAMEPEMMPVQGTDLGEALRMSLDALDQGAREDRIVVLVTDGEDHEGQLDPQLQRAIEAGVRVHTVGIGSVEGVPIPEPGTETGRRGFKRDEEGNVVTTRLDETTLRNVAEATGGRFVRVAPGTTGFEDLVDEIAAGEGDEVDTREITQFEEQYQLFLAFSFILLVAEALVPERRRAAETWSGRFE
ncbi:MAG: VWA domain-containing protein [Gemmatimonadetes bacterium]|nr:VWA domain-containing protein [Gemmatimonadota bacterium]